MTSLCRATRQHQQGRLVWAQLRRMADDGASADVATSARPPGNSRPVLIHCSRISNRDIIDLLAAYLEFSPGMLAPRGFDDSHVSDNASSSPGVVSPLPCLYAEYTHISREVLPCILSPCLVVVMISMLIAPAWCESGRLVAPHGQCTCLT